MSTHRIEELIKKGNEEGLTSKEENYLKFLLLELQNRPWEELTIKERSLVKGYESYMRDKGISISTDQEYDEKIQRMQAAFEARIRSTEEKIVPMIPERSISRKYRITAWAGGIAAAVALLIAISLPLLKNDGAAQPNSTLVAQNQIDRQFISNTTMKKITLADGSTVHLNMGTTLSLHKGKFNADTREVWLDEGEAFFEVSKDPNRPFIVHTPDGLSTRVLGTSFNIKAYRELGEQVISVKTGRVQVSRENGDKVLLTPDNKASFNTQSETLTAGLTNGTDAAAWRTGDIVLSDAHIGEVALRLKQYYNITLVNNARIAPQTEVYMAFSIHMPIEKVAATIANVYHVQYKINKESNQLILN